MKSFILVALAIGQITFCSGCDRSRADSEKLNLVMKEDGVFGIMVNDELQQTNIISNRDLISLLSPTNRIKLGLDGKNYSFGRVMFYQETNYLIGIDYLGKGVFSFRNYGFRLKETNDVTVFLDRMP